IWATRVLGSYLEPTDEKPVIENGFREPRTQFGSARDRELGHAPKRCAVVLPPHGWCIRVLHLEPIGRAAFPLRDEAHVFVFVILAAEVLLRNPQRPKCRSLQVTGRPA